MIRVLVADDEAPARAKIRSLLAREPDVEVVAEASDGEEAAAMVGDLRPDLVLLDIQMPKLDGFGVIQKIGVDAMPLTVFITAYDEHALKAFEVHALDYLLKPFAPSRFKQVLERVRRQLTRPAPADLSQRIERLIDAVRPTPRYPRQIMVDKGEERQVLVPVDSIDRIIADRNDYRLLTRGGEFTRRGTLAEIEQKLDPEKFLRINRSEIVRLDAVAEFQPWFHGDYRVKMKDGTTLTWSRRYRALSNLER